MKSVALIGPEGFFLSVMDSNVNFPGVHSNKTQPIDRQQ